MDIHFRLMEKIEETRPKRNGSGDIEKCVIYCEEGMDNLESFLREWRGNFGDDYPPSIPCRDQLIRCYLMVGDYTEAKGVVKRCMNYGVWSGEEAEAEMTRINNVETAKITVFERLKDYPGTLQTDFYRIYPDVDREAMKWFFANSNLLIKRKQKSTYLLFLPGQDIPLEDISDKKQEIQGVAQSIKLVPKDLIDYSNFPDWYISLSFGYSTSKNYSKALMLAKQAPQYIESEDEFGNVIHQAVYSSASKEYLAFITLYELIGAWKSAFVVINNEIVDRKIVGGINYCYGDKIRSGNPDFCYGASPFTANPFGCHRLQISSYNNPWWTFGHFEKKGLWRIDKEALKERIAEYSIPYLSCPAFSYGQVLDGLNNLPDYINTKNNDEWIVMGDSITPKESVLEHTFKISLDDNKTQPQMKAKNVGCLTTIISVSFMIFAVLIL